MSKKNVRQLLLIVLPFALAGVLYLISLFVIKYIKLPPCIFYFTTGFYCPGCGNTRAVIALLHGDILLSLRQNAMIITAIVCGIILYTEPVFKAFGKTNYRSPIRNYYFLYIMIGIFTVYCLVRNFVPAIAPI